MTVFRYDKATGKVVEATEPSEQRDALASQNWANADRHFTTKQLPAHYRYHKEAGGTFDERGNCQFSSMEQVRKTMAVANAHGEGLTYGE